MKITFNLLLLLLTLTIPNFLYAQGGELREGRSYAFSDEEIESGFALEQLFYLADSNKFCLHNKSVSGVFLRELNIKIPEGYLMATIDYQDYFTTFILVGYRTMLIFAFSNTGNVRVSGQYFRDRITDRNEIENEISQWATENKIDFSP